MASNLAFVVWSSGESTVHDNATRVKVLLVLVTLGCSVLIGCAESESRQAGRKLMEQTSKAKRLHGKALETLAGSPGVASDGKTLIDIPAEKVHAEALAIIARAEDNLVKAIAEAGSDAPKADMAIAENVMGRLLALKGHCYTEITGKAIQRLEAGRLRAQIVLSTANWQVGMFEYYKTLGSLGDADVVIVRDRADRQAAVANDALDAIDGELSQLARDKQSYVEQYEASSSQARSLRGEAELESGQAGLDKMDKALELQTRADTAELKAAAIEFRTDSLNNRRKPLELDLAAATQASKAAQDVIAARGKQMDNIAASEMRISTQLSEKRAKLRDVLTEIATASSQIGDGFSKATNAYSLAIKRLKAAGNLSQEADIHMAAADLKIRCLLVLTANQNMGKSIRELWAETTSQSTPASVRKMETFIAKVEQVRSEARDSYSRVAELYKRSLRDVERQQRWVYQGHIAAAYWRLYKLTNDEQDLQAARQMLDDALEGKEKSPYLAPLVELRKMLENDS